MFRTFKIQIGESNIVLRARGAKIVEKAFHVLQEQRASLKAYANEHPEFLNSFTSIDVPESAPVIAKRMAVAAKHTGVGPMASVAGAISEAIGESIQESVIVDNGGDAYLKLEQEADLAIYAGSSKLSKRIGFRVKPSETPLGICTSSGTVGHSHSFGRADAVTVVADSAALADAVATAAGNLVKTKEDIKRALEYAKSIPGVRGALAILGGNVGMIGALPKLIRMEDETSELLT